MTRNLNDIDKKNEIKQREERIKNRNKSKKEAETFDYDTETVKLTDKQYDNLCKQLLTEQSSINIEDTDYYNAFYDFDGSTGFHLYSRLTDKQRIYVDSIVNAIRFNKR